MFSSTSTPSFNQQSTHTEEEVWARESPKGWSPPGVGGLVTTMDAVKHLAISEHCYRVRYCRVQSYEEVKARQIENTFWHVRRFVSTNDDLVSTTINDRRHLMLLPVKLGVAQQATTPFLFLLAAGFANLGRKLGRRRPTGAFSTFWDLLSECCPGRRAIASRGGERVCRRSCLIISTMSPPDVVGFARLLDLLAWSHACQLFESPNLN